jgi:hypothetical protein
MALICTGIDSNLSDNFGRSIMYSLSAFTTFLTISIVGGWPFVAAAFLLGILYYNGSYMYIHSHYLPIHMFSIVAKVNPPPKKKEADT